MFDNNINNYVLKVELAKCFDNRGTVYLAQHRPTKKHVAMKKFLVEDLKNDISFVMDEAKQLREFDHPNILSYHTMFVNYLDLYFVLPLMCYGSCKDTMSNYFETGFPEPILVCILRDILQGLVYLHWKGYIHRSLRASHVFLNETRAVIGGFRVCTSILGEGKRIRTLHDLPPHSVKSLNWLAPEVLAQNLIGYTEKSDVYSLAMTAYEMANGAEPYYNITATLILAEKLKGGVYLPMLLDATTVPNEDGPSNEPITPLRQIYVSRQFSDALHNFAERCSERDPKNRPSASALLSHPVFKLVANTNIKEQFAQHCIQKVDFDSIQDSDINLQDSFSQMRVETGSSFEWDFDDS